MNSVLVSSSGARLQVGRQAIAIVVVDLHVEAPGPFCDRATDAAHSDDAQAFSAHMGGHQLSGMPTFPPVDVEHLLARPHAAGCTRVWFSFQTGHRDAVARARELGMEVVEIGRCPVYYLDGAPAACKAHTAMTKVSGTWRRPPQLDAEAERRELW